MKQIHTLSFFNVITHLLRARWFLVSLLLALLSGFLLFAFLADFIMSGIIQAGFDTQRAQLTSALLLAASAALLGAAFTQRKFGAIIGAVLTFSLRYLAPFIQLELQPVFDPGGYLEPLNSAALIHTACVMAALGILSAFIGSVVGSALSEILLEPPFTLVKNIRSSFPKQNISHQRTEQIPRQHVSVPERTTFAITGRWVALVAMVTIFILASQSTDLFLLTPEVNIHTRPVVHSLATDIPVVGQTVKVTIISKTLGNKPSSFMLYLPPTYHTTVGKDKRYPTLYLLHGSPGGITDWLRAGNAAISADTLIDTKQTSELIMVMPDGNSFLKATSEWGNSANHKQMMENYVANELVRYVDQHYRTIPNPADRAIGGLSMGGFGAMNIAIHHPNIFGSVIALGGYYQTMFSTIWGNNPTYRHYNSPLIEIVQAPQAWKLHIFLGDATQDQPFYTYTKQFISRLTTLHIPYTFVSERGHHSWSVWSRQLYQALQWLKWGPTHTPPQKVAGTVAKAHK